MVFLFPGINRFVNVKVQIEELPGKSKYRITDLLNNQTKT